MKTVDFFDARAMEGIRQVLYDAHASTSRDDVSMDTQIPNSDVICQRQQQHIISNSSFQQSVREFRDILLR